jgi:hypothetical protein
MKTHLKKWQKKALRKAAAKRERGRRASLKPGSFFKTELQEYFGMIEDASWKRRFVPRPVRNERHWSKKAERNADIQHVRSRFLAATALRKKAHAI